MTQFEKIVDGEPKAGRIHTDDLPAHSHRLEIEGNYDEFPLAIGILPANSRVNKTVIETLNVFDEGSITIGDDDAQGRLVTSSENDLLSSNIFAIENFVKYEVDTEIKAYLTGTPTQGRVSIIVFFS